MQSQTHIQTKKENVLRHQQKVQLRIWWRLIWQMDVNTGGRGLDSAAERFEIWQVRGGQPWRSVVHSATQVGWENFTLNFTHTHTHHPLQQV